MTCASASSSALLSSAAPVAAPRRQLSPALAFYLLASITVTFLAGSSAPTPLYPIYQAQWGLSAMTVTVVFGVYALALLGALLVTGRLSDHIGRRPVLIAAALVQAVTMLVFATAGGLTALLVARIIQGLATGAAVAAVGAGMIDLDKARGPVANSVAPPIGTALGAVFAGLMVHFLPAPTWLVYAVLSVVFVAQAAGVLFMAETVTPRAGALASLKPQFGVPAAVRKPLMLAVPVLVAVWAIAGFFGSLGPALMRMVFGWDASLAGGLVLFVLAGSGAVAVLLFHRRAPGSMMGWGAAALIGGLAVALTALQLHSGFGFFVGAVVAGAGFGSGFQGALRTVVAAAAPHERAGVLSVIFVVSYLAMGIPAIIAGLVVANWGHLLLVAQGYGAMVMALAAVALLGAATARLRQPA